MKQDTLHIRDAVSKTITVTPQFATIISDFDDDEMVIPKEYMQTIEDMFQFAYNRADEFLEGKNGVMLSISGGQYPEQIGDKAQAIYKAVKQ
jgi:adenylosuccinate synthase